MATVIKKFRERYQDMKLYQIGDKYPEDDFKRVQYLIEQGYLSKEAESETESEDRPRRRKKGVTDDGDPDA
ncbi:hypothetical protein P4U99_03435 [Brevibacillus agri]|uniref:hypothetical protein n=1 Tax=Brevibacillus agri TaxID=51101 RepID=UPI002E1F32EC|nr:hypothetical protein [Brevibacillus agri]MED1652596.1 hypothetical protein [Brevibacillus agri]MED1689650.1 hypothetical protein [Brevibacillus agri]MED1691112.1 hypothetical protein [Brevibacillus agri]MED1696778.1 hypothetical protein [Brevibacillus agri]